MPVKIADTHWVEDKRRWHAAVFREGLFVQAVCGVVVASARGPIPYDPAAVTPRCRRCTDGLGSYIKAGGDE